MIQLRGTRTLVAYIMATALRDRLFLAFLVLTTLAVAIGVFIGGTAVVEKHELSVVYVATATRLILVMGLVLFVCFHLRRAFESREVEMMLSRPISRVNFVFAHVISFVVLALVAVVIAAVVVGLVARPEPAALLRWSLSLWLECIIMVLTAMFFSLALPSAVANVLACIGFYVLARMIGLLTGIAKVTSEDATLLHFAGQVMEAISIVIPRLDLFGQTSWLIYGVGSEISFAVIALQGLVYTPLIVAAAIFDMERWQF
jgi:hypothetical protein